MDSQQQQQQQRRADETPQRGYYQRQDEPQYPQHQQETEQQQQQRRENLYASSIPTGEYQSDRDAPSRVEYKVDRLAQSMMAMQVRAAVPPPADFRLGGSTDIGVFFRSFEEYCEFKYPKSRESWSRVLRPFLRGEIQEAFDALDGARQDYQIVRAQLEAFYQDRQRGREDHVAEFFGAMRRASEPLSVLALRLGQLAERAFRDQSAAARGDFIKMKFVALLPETLKPQVKTLRRTNPEMPFASLVQLLTDLDEPTFGETGMIAAISNPPPMNLGSQAGQWRGPEGASSNFTGPPKASEKKPCGFCGKTNHLEDKCYQKPCSICQRKGHKEADCFKAKTEQKCTYCSRVGHAEADCYRKQSKCRICDTLGHFARDCPNASQLGDNRASQRLLPIPCNFCGEVGHNLRGCGVFSASQPQPQATALSCNFCAGAHLMRDCEGFHACLAGASNARCSVCNGQHRTDDCDEVKALKRTRALNP